MFHCRVKKYLEDVDSFADNPAFLDEGILITHGHFSDMLRAFGYRLSEFGVQHDSTVVVRTNDHLISTLIFFCLRRFGRLFYGRASSRSFNAPGTYNPFH